MITLNRATPEEIRRNAHQGYFEATTEDLTEFFGSPAVDFPERRGRGRMRRLTWVFRLDDVLITLCNRRPVSRDHGVTAWSMNCRPEDADRAMDMLRDLL